MAMQVMDPVQQEKEYGFSYPPLPVRGTDPVIDRALDMVKAGTSPYIIRELDSATGAQHFQYALPSQAPSPIVQNANIWTKGTDGSWVWLDSTGQVATAPSWAPPKPVNMEAQVVPVTVQYPSGQTVTIQDTRANPATQPDAKAGVTQTTAPAGAGTAPQTKANAVGGTTMDEQIQAAAMAAMSRTDLNWDEWGFFYRQVTGDAAPAPEDRGFSREADGSVLVGGRTNYPYSAWRNAAFGGAGATNTGAGAGAGAGAGGGAGTGSGTGTGSGGAGGGAGAQKESFLGWIEYLLRWLLGMLAAGKAGAK